MEEGGKGKGGRGREVAVKSVKHKARKVGSPPLGMGC